MTDKTSSENITRFGLAEIIPLKTMTVPPYTTTNAIIYGKVAFVVVDPGSSDGDQQVLLAQHLQARIDSGQRFFGVCLTHHHGDHVKAATYLSGHFSVPIMAHKNARSHLKFPVDREIEDQEKIIIDRETSLHAIHTPGHADDHLVFFDKTHGVLIAGDMVTDRGTVLIPPMSGSLKDYLHSLNALTTLPIKAIIPAHGWVISKAAILFLLKALKHRYERIKSVLNVLIDSKATLLDATDITLLVYQNLVSKDLLIYAQLSVESSLQWLLDMGLIKNLDHKWQALQHVDNLTKKALLDPVKEIDERLRHA